MGDFRVNSQEIADNGVTGLPAKPSVWSRVKSFWLQEITVELTPRQQEFENKMNEILNQEITFQKFRDFLFQEIKITR